MTTEEILTSQGYIVKVYNENTGYIITNSEGIGLSNNYIIYSDGKIAFDLWLGETKYNKAVKAIKEVIDNLK